MEVSKSFISSPILEFFTLISFLFNRKSEDRYKIEEATTIFLVTRPLLVCKGEASNSMSQQKRKRNSVWAKGQNMPELVINTDDYD